MSIIISETIGTTCDLINQDYLHVHNDFLENASKSELSQISICLRPSEVSLMMNGGSKGFHAPGPASAQTDFQGSEKAIRSLA